MIPLQAQENPDLALLARMAAKRAKRRIDAGNSLADFVRIMYPGYRLAPHIRLLIDHLEWAARTPGARLIVTMPPRHGKSLLASQHFPAWVLGKFPDKRIMGIAHTDNLAFDFSRQVRNKFRMRQWPFRGVRIAPDKGAVKAWAIDGSLTGGYTAFGMNGSPTGLGADIMLIDDPIKNHKDAASLSYREGLKETYRETLRGRLQPGGSIILISTRWHHDDLTGFLLSEAEAGGERWVHLHLPAYSLGEGDLLDRPEGEVLWPEVWTPEEMEVRRIAVGSHAWTTQYQGMPTEEGGDLIRPPWFPPYDRIPTYANKIIQVWDTAFKAEAKHDYTVCLTAAVAESAAYVVDVFREKLEWPALQRAYTMQTRAWAPAESWIEDKASGTSLIQWARSEDGPRLAPVIALPKVENPEVAANLASPHWEAGRILLPTRAYWLDDFLREMKEFPAGAHDDQMATLTHLTRRLYNAEERRIVRSSDYTQADDDEDDDRGPVYPGRSNGSADLHEYRDR